MRSKIKKKKCCLDDKELEITIWFCLLTRARITLLYTIYGTLPSCEQASVQSYVLCYIQ